jgi:LruC domain-containing protein
MVGTIAFEDLWPSYGDYDFNDVALNYQVILKLNAQNLAVQMDLSVMWSWLLERNWYRNRNLLPSQIKVYTGTVLTENYITVNPNGTEASQQCGID